MGIWIGIAITLFVLGSIMALKPSPIDQRIDKLRMQARKLKLHPKLLACPDWIRGQDNELGKGMLAQYRIVNDDWQLPLARYQIIDDEWRPLGIDGQENMDFSLDKVAVDFPKDIKPLVKGLSTQANCIIVYWQDGNYVKPATNSNFSYDNIETDLTALKETLDSLATIVNQS